MSDICTAGIIVNHLRDELFPAQLDTVIAQAEDF